MKPARERIASFRGETLLDGLNRTVDAMISAEQSLLKQRQAAAADSAADARHIMVAGTTATFLLLALSAGIIRRDVQARRRAEAALTETSALQRAILDAANSTIISCAPNGTIRTFNSAAERMLGYRADALVGKQTPALLHDPAAASMLF